MWRGGAVTEVCVLLTVSLHLSSAVTHSLQYVYTAVTPGINFPEFTSVGLVDGQGFMYYDSNIRKAIPKTEWIQKVTDDDQYYWNRETEHLQDLQDTFKADMDIAMQRFNQTKGVHTIQWMYGCELDDDGTTRGYEQYGYDGEDFLIFDLKTLIWVAPKPQAEKTKNKWDPDTGLNKGTEDYLENTCIEWLMKYVSYGRETLERKVVPEASVFQRHSSSPEVVCHATGFFPKAVMISWQKDGEDVYEDVDLRETLHNQDGSFQIRSILKVSAEELQKHTYTCVVQHSSLEKELVLKVDERRILKDEGSGGAPIAVITAVVTALVVLVTVVAGIVVWKKKISGFKPVPAKPYANRVPHHSDSSSNSSQDELLPTDRT